MTTAQPDRGARPADRLTALSGLGAVVLFVLAIDLAAPPSGADSSIATTSETLARTMADNAASAEAAVACGLAGVLLLVLFVGRLHGLLAAAAPPGSSLPGATLVAGAAVVTAQLLGAALALAAASPDGYLRDAEVAKAILLLGWNSAYLLAPGLAALIVVWTAAAFTTSLLPRWAAWVGAGLVGVLLVLVAAGVYGMAVLPGFVWLSLLSLTLAVRPPVLTPAGPRPLDDEREPSRRPV